MPSKDEISLKDLINKADKTFRDVRTRKESAKLYYEALTNHEIVGNQAEIAYIKGKLSFIDEDYISAFKFFEKAADLDHDHLNAIHYKGLIFDILGYNEKAVECYKHVLNKKPDFAWSMNNLGVVYAKMHDFERAAKCYDKVIALDLDDLLTVTAQYNKGRDYYDWGVYSGENKHFYEALNCFDKALGKDPTYYYAYNRKGLVYHQLEEYKLAIENYDNVLAIKSDYTFSKENKKLAERLLQYDNEIEAIKKDKSIDDAKRNEKLIKLDAEMRVKKKLIDKMDSIQKTKEKNESRFKEFLKPREKPLNENFFMVLRRWNSYTPAMVTEPGLYNGIKLDYDSYLNLESNLGGGYFLYWNNKGIVIDPGFDFLDNFFYNKLSVSDIDAVVITHAHVDHSIDFEPLITLIYEFNENLDEDIRDLKAKLGENKDKKNLIAQIEDKEKKKKNIDVFINLGVLKKILGWLPIHDNNNLINRVYPLEKDVSYDLVDYNLKITAKAAIHSEILCNKYAVGLIFALHRKDKDDLKIGFTSDTKHDEMIEDQYKDMHIIVPHLGSIEDDFMEVGESISESDHLQFSGIIPVINKSNAKLAIISEFGEELDKYRLTLVDALNDTFFNTFGTTKCLTGDIGLKVKLPQLQIRCDCCTRKFGMDMYVDYKEILEGFNRKPNNKCDNGVFHFCKNCYDNHGDNIEKKP